MQTLRRARLLARLVLVWFVLALGAAVASPLVKSQPMELVCSSVGSVKLVQLDGADGDAARPQALDCPLCLLAQPVLLPFAPAAAQPLVAARHSVPIAGADWASHSAAALPARGPPSRA